MAKKYNPKDPYDILQFGRQLIGMSFDDILKSDDSISSEKYQEIYDNYNSSRRRGGLGNLVEENYFHIPINSSPEPDFPEAELELKVTPFDLLRVDATE